MAISPIEKNNLENIDLLQIEYFSDLSVSKKDIVVIESINPLAITIRKFLVRLGFENICVCKEVNEGIKIFSHFIGNDMNVPIIIDNESTKNIKNTIKEILEIQPSANIMVMTTKEKTNPQLLRLFDIGASSSVQKPLIFDDFKKSLSHMLEKNDNIQETKTGKDFESIISSWNQISHNKIKDILNVEQSELETIIKSAIENRRIFLDKEILEAACNQCDSTNITYLSECPHCNGINIKQKDLIQHYSCGKVYPKETEQHTCPQCNKEIGSAGTDYREISDHYVCSSCDNPFPKPLSKFTCLNCGNNFIDKLVSWKKSKLYKIQR